MSKYEFWLVYYSPIYGLNRENTDHKKIDVWQLLCSDLLHQNLVEQLFQAAMTHKKGADKWAAIGNKKNKET